MDSKAMTAVADNIRILSASMVEKAKSGHPGGAMGGADFINVLYSQFLVYDPDDTEWILRDRFFLDPGHMSPMLYSVLALSGFYTIDELKEFRQWGSSTPGHPEHNLRRGIENTSGPLGQGHAMAVGCAIAERFLVARFGKTLEHKTYAFISDGGIQEEISQGAGRIAGYLKLSNLIMFYDSNGVQLSTTVDAVDREDVAAKYRAWGWYVMEIEGNDPAAISAALKVAGQITDKPTLIIGNTAMGKGAVTAGGNNYEGQTSTHGQPLSKSGADVDATIRHLGGDPKDPWKIFDVTKEVYAERAAALRRQVGERRAAFRQWEIDNPEQAELLKQYFSGVPAPVDYNSIEHKPGCSTRQASADVLAVLAKKEGNMIVASADLANSDRTDGFLNNSRAFSPGNFRGAFLHAGVSELSMASIINGMVLHGGIIAACGTFFVFSDYMKPAIRLAALMELPVKYIWSHDAFRVGEDGPTHQPVEQEAQIRLMELTRNLSGRPSMLVLRPADGAETSVAYSMAMDNMLTPTALVLSRQDVPDLPAEPGTTRIEAAQGARRGGYTVMHSDNPDIVMVANGSEVSLLCQCAVLLEAEGIRAAVVSMPSIGLFNEQDEAYRHSVLPAGVPQFGLTAGLPITINMIKGFHGEVFGLDHFGASAPYKVLDEKFGFTTDNVCAVVRRVLGRTADMVDMER